MGTIGFVGMSHLGVNHAASASEKGFNVLAYDPDSAVIESLRDHKLDFNEPGLREVLIKNDTRIQYSSKLQDLKKCDVVYLAKDVPTNDKGQSDLTDIRSLLKDILANVSETAIVVVLCQVIPGFTRSIEFDESRLYYQVETLIFGQALDRALYPERYIIGCANKNKELPSTYQKFLDSYNCPLLKMRYESAELAKISINLFLISQVTTTNTIAEISEKIGADWFEIKESLQLDRRIGKYAYLNPGLGIAGGNLERDINSTLELSYRNGTKSTLVESWLDDCAYRRDWVLRILNKEIFPKYGKDIQIGVLGLSYKPDTSSIKNSPSLYLLNQLKGSNIIAYDPAVKSTEMDHVQIAKSFEDVCHAKIILVMTPWSEFRQNLPKNLSKAEVIIDPYNLFLNDNLNQNSNDLKYISIGRSA